MYIILPRGSILIGKQYIYINLFWVYRGEVEEPEISRARRVSREGSKMGSKGRNRSRSPRDDSRHSRQSNNVYDSLNDNAMEHELVNESNNQNYHINNVSTFGDKTVKRIPPITLENADVAYARDLLNRISFIKTPPNFKVLDKKVKIYTRNVTDFQKIVKYMSDNKIDGFTHPVEQKVKFCLFGLDRIDPDDIKQELSVLLNVTPANVFSLPLKEKRHNDHYIYVVHFMKSDGITLNKLKLIRGLFNIIVRWDHYVPFKNRDPNLPKPPTQCSNCQSFEHGSQFCFRPPRCIRCGQGHKSADCPFLLSRDEKGVVTKHDRINEVNISCANCKGKHTANFRDCAKRIEIIDKRARLKSKPTRHQFIPPSLNDVSNFPPPEPLSKPIGNNSWQNTSSHHSTQQHRSQQHSSQRNHNQDNRNENLFSRQTCNEILTEFISRLSNCRTKQEQLTIIGDIAFRFLYDD